MYYAAVAVAVIIVIGIGAFIAFGVLVVVGLYEDETAKFIIDILAASPEAVIDGVRLKELSGIVVCIGDGIGNPAVRIVPYVAEKMSGLIIFVV